MGKLNIACIFIFCFMCLFVFDGENEGHKIVQKITFGFLGLFFKEKGINVLNLDLYFRPLSVHNALPLHVWLF